MNIRELISLVEGDGLDEVSVKRFAKQPAAEPAADNTVPFPNQGAAPADDQAQAPAQGPTGDATLDQPLPPKDPNAPGFGKKAAGVLGKIGKGIGAVASVPQGLGRAIKKGYQAGVQGIGGPGAAAPAAGGARQSRAGAASGGGAGGQAEVDDLRSMINRLDARMTAAGIKERKKN